AWHLALRLLPLVDARKHRRVKRRQAQGRPGQDVKIEVPEWNCRHCLIEVAVHRMHPGLGDAKLAMLGCRTDQLLELDIIAPQKIPLLVATSSRIMKFRLHSQFRKRTRKVR